MSIIYWKQESVAGVNYLALQGWLPRIVHAFSTRLGGASPSPFDSLNLGYSTEDDSQNVDQNRDRFLSVLGVKDLPLHSLRQIHSSQVHWVVTSRNSSSVVPERDALITRDPGNIIGILTADCYPILLADDRQGVIAAVHAGWKGSMLGITQIVISEMIQKTGCRPEDMTALIGPAIHVCCYQVGSSVREAFLARHDFSEGCFYQDLRADQKDTPSRWKLDLLAFHRALLQKNGLSPDRIYSLPHCTCCRPDLYFSYRRDGHRTGRMLSIIGFRK